MRTRFAPSPTGYLHLGHALSALYGFQIAEFDPNQWLIRFEDIDSRRSKSEYYTAIMEDLDWLGIRTSHPVMKQSNRLAFYQAAIEDLKSKGVLYPCFCTRKEIANTIDGDLNAPESDSKQHYPGTCRELSPIEQQYKMGKGVPYSWRLNIRKAQAYLGRNIYWQDLQGKNYKVDFDKLDDVVLARKDVPTSYHLAVVVDDYNQGITHVIRGEDLKEATHIHAILYALFEWPLPIWEHHPLILDDNGKKFSKRNHTVTLRSIRQNQKLSPDQVLLRIKEAKKTSYISIDKMKTFLMAE